MNRVAGFCGISIGLLLCAVAADNAAEQPKEIPLDQIWSYRMPGTKSVRDLEPSVKLKELSIDAMVKASIVHRIYNSLGKVIAAGPVFVVKGTGSEALKNAEAVFLGDDPPETLPGDTELTLVFYSQLCGRYVHLDSIEQTKDRIRLKFHFVAHVSADMTAEFALIPLGKLKPGTVEVEVIELPTVSASPKLLRADQNPELSQRVSGSTSFNVNGE